ncbi:FAD-binding dehydrogenase [Nocardia nova]|uniref:FAD-binding dehydrogenase n=1 Tax=Nocardia nova TaxID=37330 RepID=UPI002739FD1D|nr:FAD-binding dehydrogenase [Nocardia nova]
MAPSQQPDVIVVGAGLAGLVATYELTRAGRRVLVLDQENRNNLGGQAFWSLGGLFLVDSPEQRRLGIKDSFALAWQDWLGSAGFDRDDEDHWARRWARAYVEFAAGEKRRYLHDLGLRVTPLVGWAERGGATADGHGNSVPRFHLTWGTGPEVLRVFLEPVLAAEQRGLVEFAFRHRVDDLIVEDDAVVGVRGSVLEPSELDRGVASSRTTVGEFEFRAPAVLVSSGGIGHNHELIRKNWPTERLGPCPQTMISGVPAHVDGRMLAISESAGGRIVNRDRMWHYTEGIHNWDPIWPDHAIRIIPGPSSLWFDANGKRLPAPCFPGFDTNATMKAILDTGYDYSWFVLTQSIIEKEFALSGSEQNPDITGKDLKLTLKSRAAKGAPGPVEAFKRHGVDFVVADTLPELVRGMNEIVRGMNEIARGPQLEVAALEHQIVARDRELDNKYSKDAQLMAIANARRSLGDKLGRVAAPHRILDPSHGPLIAVRLNVLTRKTLGGLQTNLDSQVIRSDGSPFPGLYAAGEVAGFGGGGVHGYNALEGTFLGGCIFSGRAAGLAMARLPR